MKPAKRPKNKASLIRNLEKKAELHVKERYLGTSFLQRHEAIITIIAIMTASLIVSIPLSLILTEIAIKTLILGGLYLTGLIFVGTSLFAVVKLTVSGIRKNSDAPLSMLVINVFAGVCVFIFAMTLILFLGIIIMTYMISLINAHETILAMAMSIGMPLTIGCVVARKLVTKKRLLPPELVKTSFLERRKLRTSKGAIQRYLLDQIHDTEKQSLESIDELLVKNRLAVKRSREFVAKFSTSISQEKRGAPRYLSDPYKHATTIYQDCTDSLTKLEAFRATIVAYFGECKDRVNGISKMMRDRKLISDFNGFSKEVKSLPQRVDDQIEKTSQNILDNAKKLEKSLIEIRNKAEIDATIAELSDASMESLEKLEETISKCIDLEIPNDDDKDDEDLG